MVISGPKAKTNLWHCLWFMFSESSLYCVDFHEICMFDTMSSVLSYPYVPCLLVALGIITALEIEVNGGGESELAEDWNENCFMLMVSSFYKISPALLKKVFEVVNENDYEVWSKQSLIHWLPYKVSQSWKVSFQESTLLASVIAWVQMYLVQDIVQFDRKKATLYWHCLDIVLKFRDMVPALYIAILKE